MKRFLPILAVCALLLPALQLARGAEASINLFYDNLGGGNWYEVADYGYVWQPEVASNSSWRPYTDGYWAYTDQGWTWVSYEDFGWATYHYGRWARLTDYGWVWVPGTEWAPAWVSWRTGGDYIGWAPLPPAGRGEVVYESRPITGHVDVEFGIGPAYYNFVDLRYIGEPVLRDRIFDYNRNVTIINNTVNVTNITYNNSTVYSYGPDYATVSRYSVRPIQRLKLERQNVDALQAVKAGNITKVQGNQLLVAAPMKLQKAANAQVAPKQVKAKIEQPRVEKGWSDVSDPKEKAKLEQKFKSENAKNIPKPNFQPKSGNAAANAGAGEAAGTGAAVATSPAERVGKGQGRKAKAQSESLPSAGATGPAASANPAAQDRRGKNKNRVERDKADTGASQAEMGENQPGKGRFEEGNGNNRLERGQADTAASPAGMGENQPGNARAKERNGKRNKGLKPDQNATPPGTGAGNAGGNDRNELKAKSENANNNATPRQGVEKGARRNQDQREAQGPPRQQPEPPRQQQERAKEQMQNPAAQNQNQPQAAGSGNPGRNREQAERKQPGRPEGPGKDKGKGKKPESEQTPTPPQNGSP